MALQTNGLSCNEKPLAFKNELTSSASYGAEGLKKILAYDREVTAFIADNSVVAMGLYEAAEELT